MSPRYEYPALESPDCPSVRARDASSARRPRQTCATSAVWAVWPRALAALQLGELARRNAREDRGDLRSEVTRMCRMLDGARAQAGGCRQVPMQEPTSAGPGEVDATRRTSCRQHTGQRTGRHEVENPAWSLELGCTFEPTTPPFPRAKPCQLPGQIHHRRRGSVGGTTAVADGGRGPVVSSRVRRRCSRRHRRSSGPPRPPRRS